MSDLPPSEAEPIVAESNGGSRYVIEVKPPVRRRQMPLPLLILLVVVIAAGTVWSILFFVGRGFETTDDAFIDGHVIAISPQVAGLVKAVHINDNTFVHKGDVLVELDPADYQVALDQMNAAAVAMGARVDQAKAEIVSARAFVDEATDEVDSAQANAENATADFNRFKELSGRTPGAVSRQQMDAASAAQQSNLAQVAQAKAKLAAAQADIATKQATVLVAEGDLKKATADVHKAQVNLGYCTIIAPEDGRVTKKSVEAGAYAQIGDQLMAIVPTDVWVTANFKETQLNRIRKGQPVEILIDAFPQMKFRGKIESIQSGTGSRFSILPAENATGNFVKVVQRVPVKILLDQPNTDRDHLLAPGMSVEPEVDVR